MTKPSKEHPYRDMNVEELLVLFTEAAQRRNGGGQPTGVAGPSPEGTEVPEELEEVDDRIENKGRYGVEEFFRFTDDDFVKNAYRALLRREPDAQGLRHYLGCLESGRFGRLEILGRLRFSGEGRAVGAGVRGLWAGLLQATLLHVPLLGGLLGLCRALLFPRRDESRRAMIAGAIQAKIRRLTLDLRKAHQRTQAMEQRLRQEGEATEQRLRQEGEATEQRLRQEIAVVRKPLEHTLRIQAANLGQAEAIEAMYHGFEDRFRGPRDEIVERMKFYLPFAKPYSRISGTYPAMDLGSGRGELVGVLRESGLNIRGLDSNGAMAGYCQGLGLPVEQGDMFDFLEQARDHSLSCLFFIHVLEHFHLEDLLFVMTQAKRVLIPGGMLAMEAPNPENVVMGASLFHIDPSHASPLHPDSVGQMLKGLGFKNQFRMSHRPLSEVYGIEGEESEVIRRWALGPLDYSILAFTPGALTI
jgi:O-antigen chain-terminating methyltransferase